MLMAKAGSGDDGDIWLKALTTADTPILIYLLLLLPTYASYLASQ